MSSAIFKDGRRANPGHLLAGLVEECPSGPAICTPSAHASGEAVDNSPRFAKGREVGSAGYLPPGAGLLLEPQLPPLGQG
jgi:hypothetical protein